MTADVRMQIRCSADEKEFLNKAAKAAGFRHLSEFVRIAAYNEARKIIIPFRPGHNEGDIGITGDYGENLAYEENK